MQKGKTMIDELMEKLLEEPVVNNDEIVFNVSVYVFVY